MPFVEKTSVPYIRAARSLSFGIRVAIGLTLSSLIGSVSFAAHKKQEASAPKSAPEKQQTAASSMIVLTVDGQTREMPFENGATLADLVKSAGIGLSPMDRCSVSAESPLVDGATITITRIKIAEVVERTSIPFSHLQSYSPSLAIGAKQIKSPGKLGQRIVKSLCTYEDGKLTKCIKRGETITAPVAQIEVVGTRGMTLASRGFFGGRRIVEMVATGYGPGGNGKWGERTASGLRPGFGVVAVDPRFIPLGTRLFIEGYGYAVAGDTGGAIKGNRIDLGRDTNAEAAAEGRKTVRVLILN